MLKLLFFKWSCAGYVNMTYKYIINVGKSIELKLFSHFIFIINTI